MNEDDLCRTSSQYKLWTFTPDQLASLRQNTNAHAVEQTKAAIRRARRKNAQDVVQEEEIDTLTSEEENKLVSFYCTNCLQIALNEPFNLPVNVAGTAVQFLKRFYLSNSPMTYHPKQIFPAALFLSTKTENMHFPLKDFADRLKTIPGLKKTNSEEILAPEYLLTQGLRFCFDIRHPHRGLRGAYLELLQIVACAKGANPPEWIKKEGDKFRFELLRIPKPGTTSVTKSITNTANAAQPISPIAFEKRVEAAHASAREILRNAALVSDAYFLFTPSQIMWAALYKSDAPLVSFFLGLKLSGPPINPNIEVSPFGPNPAIKRDKVMGAIRDCAALFGETERQKFDDIMALDKKLYHVRNPDKIDLVKLNLAQKRGGEEDGKVDDQVVKKRKLEREKSEKEAEDLFGPALVK